jgi:hypothetical protein
MRIRALEVLQLAQAALACGHGHDLSHEPLLPILADSAPPPAPPPPTLLLL